MEDQRTGGEQEEWHRRSHLFTVRLWSEALGDSRAEWRGQVRHVTSGETRYFRDWSMLAAVFLEMVAGVDDTTSNQAQL